MTQPTDEQRRKYAEWLKTLPDSAREVGERFPPWSWWRYRDLDDGFVYAPIAINDDGTFNAIKIEVATEYVAPYSVSRMRPENMIEAGSPAEERKRLGSQLTFESSIMRISLELLEEDEDEEGVEWN